MNTVTHVIVLFLGHFGKGWRKTEICWTETARKHSLLFLKKLQQQVALYSLYVCHSNVLNLDHEGVYSWKLAWFNLIPGLPFWFSKAKKMYTAQILLLSAECKTRKMSWKSTNTDFLLRFSSPVTYSVVRENTRKTNMSPYKISKA